MPKVNPEIIVWARETAGLTQEEAAKKLGFQDSSKSSATEKLAALENGDNEPSRPQLLKMEAQYRRPLLTFYLSKPPIRGSRGVDFRTLSNDRRLRMRRCWMRWFGKLERGKEWFAPYLRMKTRPNHCHSLARTG